MIKEFRFEFEQLQVNPEKIKHVLGYRDAPLPAPFDEYVIKALQESKWLTDIRGAYCILDDAILDYKKYRILAREKELHIGKTLFLELRGAEQLAVYICTAGKTICEKSKCLLQSDNPVLGYVFDVLGNVITEAAAAELHACLQDDIGLNGERLTNRYCPGTCQWSLTDQRKLFSFFPDNVCGVSLTPSFLMNPIKSVSGVIGIGKNVKYRANVCILCANNDCIYRKM